MNIHRNLKNLCCPTSKQPLIVANENLCQCIDKKRKENRLFNKSGKKIRSEITAGLITYDKFTFYPIIDDIPQLLAPEGVSTDEAPTKERISIKQSQYWEPYEEMAAYDGISAAHIESNTVDSTLDDIGMTNSQEIDANKISFPEPAALWLDAKGCVLSQEDAYRYLMPISGKTVLQIGGHGSHLIKFLLAGADEAWLISPMIGELQRARHLSRKFNLENRLITIQGIAEEIPLQNDSMDRIYSGGCLHHTQTDMVAPEIKRILKQGGKASFVDPVLTLPYRMFVRPFYSRGIGRVDQAHCTPIDHDALYRFLSQFENSKHIPSRTFVHLPLTMATRYLKMNPTIDAIRSIEKIDKKIANLVPPIQKRFSPIAALCVQK